MEFIEVNPDLHIAKDSVVAIQLTSRHSSEIAIVLVCSHNERFVDSRWTWTDSKPYYQAELIVDPTGVDPCFIRWNLIGPVVSSSGMPGSQAEVLDLVNARRNQLLELFGLVGGESYDPR